MPTLSASSSASFCFGRSSGENNVYADVQSFNNSYGLSSSLSIFGGMRKVNNIRIGKINRITGRHMLDQRRNEVASTTMERFFNVLYYKKMVVLAESQLEESRLNLCQTERMEELGVKGFPDVAEMRAQEAASSYELTNWQNMFAISIILLKGEVAP